MYLLDISTMTPSAISFAMRTPARDACSTMAPGMGAEVGAYGQRRKQSRSVTLGRIFISSSIIEALQGNRNFEGKRLNCTLRVYSNGDMISLRPSDMDV